VDSGRGRHPVLPGPRPDGGRVVGPDRAGAAPGLDHLQRHDMLDHPRSPLARTLPVVGAGEERPGRSRERHRELHRGMDGRGAVPGDVPRRRLRRGRPHRPAVLAGGHDGRRPLDRQRLREPDRVARRGAEPADPGRLQRRRRDGRRAVRRRHEGLRGRALGGRSLPAAHGLGDRLRAVDGRGHLHVRGHRVGAPARASSTATATPTFTAGAATGP
jgi:hypothetical protein